MIYPFQLHNPKVAEEVFIAPGAQVIGMVTLARGVSIWYNAVLRGDTDTITVGEGSNIQDLTVVHADFGVPTQIGSGVTVGHSCIIHGCSIGANSLIGMGSTVMNGAVIGENSLVGAGSLVTEGKVFPPGSVIMGRPAKLVREVSPQDLATIRNGNDHYRDNARKHARSLSSG